MVTDPFGTDIASLVPMNLDPEPEGWGEAEGHPDNGATVTPPEAVQEGDSIPDEELDDADLDEEADLATLRAVGDRGGVR